MTTLPSVKLDRGIHVMHLFYRIDFANVGPIAEGGGRPVRYRLETLCATNTAPSQNPRLSVTPHSAARRIRVHALPADLGHLGQMPATWRRAFPGPFKRFTAISVT